MSNENQSSLDSIWESEDSVFADKELLDIEHIPDEERIIGREDEISNLANSIHPAIRGGKPRNTLIYGKTGTGKSRCQARYSKCRKLRSRAGYETRSRVYRLYSSNDRDTGRYQTRSDIQPTG